MKICSLFSGSDGNCTYIHSDNTRLLVDVGISGTKAAGALKDIGVSVEALDGILVTHEHIDHIKGVGVLSRKYNLKVFATGRTFEAMKKTVGDIALCNTIEIEKNSYFNINDIEVHPFGISHDAIDPVAYSFYNKNKKISVCTDLGYVSRGVYENLKGSDILLLEANHDLEMLSKGPYPFHLKKRISGNKGHISNSTCANVLKKLACEPGNCLRSVMLGHLSKENNTKEIALKTVNDILNEDRIDCLTLEVLTKDKHSNIYSIV